MAFRTNKTPVLQTKSASGAVATFNTALAMPLSSCNIAVNAWQDGSGDPSPVNERPIHGFSEVNAYQRAVNLWDEEHEGGTINTSTGANQGTDVYGERSKNFIAIKPNTSVYVRSPNAVNIFILEYDKNKNFIRYNGYKKNEVYNVSADAYYIRFYSNNTTYRLDGVCINYPSTDTEYHAYTGNIYTIQLGQEVYGGTVDLVNGVMRVDRKLINAKDRTWILSAAGVAVYTPTDTDNSITIQYPTGRRPIISSAFVYSDMASLPNQRCGWGGVTNNKNLFVRYDELTTSLDTWNTFINANDIEFVYYIEPFDIQLTPTQIETIAGKTNTIFADTGDIDLTYKDLDIAKRGNFREVFKLPS